VSAPGQSLRRRLLQWVIGAVALAWVLAVALTWWDARHELEELLDGHLAQAAALLLAQQRADADGDDEGIDAPALHRYAPKVAFQVFDGARLVMHSANAPATPLVAPERLPAGGFATVRNAAGAWRVFAAQDDARRRRVYVAEALASRSEISLAVLRQMLWPGLAALPLLAALLWTGVERSTRPLRRLRSALLARAPDALAPLVVADLPLEMLPVLKALNLHFRRVRELMGSERRFTADAAHELRTPIAAIRTHAQVAMGETDADLRRHALQRTLDGCDRAARVIDQLLTLSKLEADTAPPKSALDLAELVRQVVGELAPAALAKQQRMDVEAAGTCVIDGNETLLRVMIRNLVDNAVRYCPAGARIAVALTALPERGFRLRIDDSGPGMSNDDLARLGDRFFRVLAGHEPGSGLGWSIIRRIAAVHGGTVAVGRSGALGGLGVDVAT
jgi:two-component system sensor histidine kinase QseC